MTPAAILRQAIERWLARRADRKKSGRIGVRSFLAPSALAMSAVSFVTTYEGLLNFLDPWPLVAAVTFSVQALILATAWELGYQIKSPAPRMLWPALIGSVFVFCFVISAFFSLTSLFDRVYKPHLQAIDRQARVATAVDTTVAELRRLRAAHVRQVGEETRASQAFADWRNRIEQIEALAFGADEILGERVRAEAERRQAAAASAASAQAERRLQLADASARLKKAQDELATTRARIQALEKRLEAPLAELTEVSKGVAIALDDMRREENGQDGRPAGRGQKWRAAKQRFDALSARESPLREEVEPLQAEIERLRISVPAIEQQAQKLAVEEAKRRAVFEASGGVVNTEQTVIQREAARGASIESRVQTIRRQIAAFAPPYGAEALASIRAGGDGCIALLANMRTAPVLEARLKDLSCGIDRLAVILAPVEAAGDAYADLLERCGQDKVNAAYLSTLGFHKSIGLARDCLSAAALEATTTAPYRTALQQLEREESPDASYFVRTTNAVLAGEKLAVFALVIAVGIDLIVLFLGLIGAEADASGLPASVRGVRNARPRLEHLHETLRIAGRQVTPQLQVADLASWLLSLCGPADSETAGKKRKGAVLLRVADVDPAMTAVVHLTAAMLEADGLAERVERDDYLIYAEGKSLLETLAGEGQGLARRPQTAERPDPNTDDWEPER